MTVTTWSAIQLVPPPPPPHFTISINFTHPLLSYTRHTHHKHLYTLTHTNTHTCTHTLTCTQIHRHAQQIHKNVSNLVFYIQLTITHMHRLTHTHAHKHMHTPNYLCQWAFIGQITNTIQYRLLPAPTPILTPHTYLYHHLASHHWLPFDSHIQYKFSSLCNNCLHTSAHQIYKPACQLYLSSDTAILCLPPLSAHLLGHFLLLHNLSGAWPPSQANMKSYPPPPPHPVPIYIQGLRTHHTVPARTLLANIMALLMSLVKTAAPRP